MPKPVKVVVADEQHVLEDGEQIRFGRGALDRATHKGKALRLVAHVKLHVVEAMQQFRVVVGHFFFKDVQLDGQLGIFRRPQLRHHRVEPAVVKLVAQMHAVHEIAVNM
jgi:hypothetical protein